MSLSMKSIIFLIISSAILSLSDASSSLGSFCNPIEGCGHSSLICLKNQCECAPGYSKLNNTDKCQLVGCDSDTICQLLDSNRKCNFNNNQCDHCTSGLILDPTANRCITLLGNGCTKSRDCWNNEDSDISTTRLGFDELPICRSGRCVCRTDYFPSQDWSRCEPRNCSSQDECNPFGDDPYRVCSKSLSRCMCALGYYENPIYSICLPYIPIQYSLMMPFWLTIIMFTVCILVYISRRLARARTEANATSAAAAAAAASNTDESAEVPHVLNLPPPSYDTIVKETVTPAEEGTSETTEGQPPNYTSLSIVQQQA